MSNPPLLLVEDLSIEFRTRGGTVKALERVSFEVRRGETVGIVGESGSGKSVTAFALMGILDPAARIASGRIVMGGMEILAMPERALAELRGREMAMIFQNPRVALNPIRKVGRQIEDILLRHANVTRDEVRQRSIAALAAVRIPDPERRWHAYPFELSGGMCQRVMIAMALACAPALLIADEPTTGLDVTTQAAIMGLVRELSLSREMATVLITHDLHLAGESCDRIVVMHAGHVVETAPTEELFRAARHPYTRRLIAATPTAEMRLAEVSGIPGGLPDLRGGLPPCRFAHRCERRAADCDGAALELAAIAERHLVACRHPLSEAAA